MRILRKIVSGTSGGGYGGDLYFILISDTIMVEIGKIQWMYPNSLTDGRMIIDGMVEML